MRGTTYPPLRNFLSASTASASSVEISATIWLSVRSSSRTSRALSRSSSLACRGFSAAAANRVSRFSSAASISLRRSRNRARFAPNAIHA
jgi:hypothetical protein